MNHQPSDKLELLQPKTIDQFGRSIIFMRQSKLEAKK